MTRKEYHAKLFAVIKRVLLQILELSGNMIRLALLKLQFALMWVLCGVIRVLFPNDIKQNLIVSIAILAIIKTLRLALKWGFYNLFVEIPLIGFLYIIKIITSTF